VGWAFIKLIELKMIISICMNVQPNIIFSRCFMRSAFPVMLSVARRGLELFLFLSMCSVWDEFYLSILFSVLRIF
jgi:hypothetical protein